MRVIVASTKPSNNGIGIQNPANAHIQTGATVATSRTTFQTSVSRKLPTASNNEFKATKAP